MRFLLEKFKNLKTSRKITLLVIGFIYIALILLCVIKVNYSLTTPGSLTKVTDFCEITEEGYSNDSGMVYGTAVYSYDRITLLKYLLTKNGKDFAISEYDPSDDLTSKEDTLAGQIYMSQSSTKAIITAYTLASKVDENVKISYSFKGMVVTDISHAHTSSDIQIGDIIVNFASHEITSTEDYLTYRSKAYLNSNGKFDCIVLRDGNEINLELDVYEEDGSTYTSWYADEYLEIDKENTYPSFEIKSSSVSGPSSGLMQSLALYNMLLSEDITKGKVIAGTGTINIDGEGKNYAGAIGAVRQKIKTASLVYNLDYFFVDEADYSDALKAFNELEDPKFELVSVSSLDDLLAFLKEVE